MKPSFSYGVKAPEQVKAFFESLTAEWRAEKEESTKLESFELQNQILTKELADTLDFTDDISQYITCNLPEGTWLGEYEPYVIDVYKGSKILGDFEKYDHSECEADTWCSLCAPGGIGAAPNVA